MNNLTVDELRNAYKVHLQVLCTIANFGEQLGPRVVKSMVESTLEHGQLTCHECRDHLTCPSAYDAYNTNGDCLEEK